MNDRFIDIEVEADRYEELKKLLQEDLED